MSPDLATIARAVLPTMHVEAHTALVPFKEARFDM